MRVNGAEAGSLIAERLEEFGVIPSFSELFDEEFHGVYGGHFVEGTSEEPGEFEFFVVEQQFFSAGARPGEINGGPDASFDEFAVENEFGVSGTFEFFEDNLVHAAAGIHESGGDNGEASTFFNAASGAEEAFRMLEGIGIDATGECFSGVWNFGIPGAGESSDAVEKDDDIVAVFDHAFRFFDDHFGHLNMP